MEKDWVLVYTSSQLHKVELLKQILHTKGVESVVLNQQDSAYISIGDIKLLVRNTEVIRAKKIIEEAGL